MKGTTIKAKLALVWTVVLGMWAIWAQGQEVLSNQGEFPREKEGGTVVSREVAKDADAPSVSIIPSVFPDPLDLETPFSFSADVQLSGDALVSAASVRWRTVVGKTTNAWTTNVLTYSSASNLWVSPCFSPLSEGTLVHYQAFVVWSSLELSGTQTTYSDIFTNLASAVAGGGVWINEIYYKFYGDEAGLWGDGWQDHEYVEICGPANQSLAGWTLRFEFSRPQVIAFNSNVARYATVSLPPHAALTNNVKDGYGFYLVGDSNTDWKVNRALGANYVPTNVNADATAQRDNIYDFDGVIRLCDNNGSPIDAIAYGGNFGDSVYAGTQPNDDQSSLSVSGANGYHAASFSWNSSAATPGYVNPGQTFTNRPVSVRTLPVEARHVATERVTPSSGQIAPFYMLDPQPARVADLLDFALAFPAAYGDKSSGALFYRREDANTWVSNGLAFYDGARNKSGEDFLHLRNPLPAYTFKRLETISYYFSVTPADSSYFTGYLASDGAGGFLVYSNETDAIDHPFTFTFPFHDEFSFTAFAPAPAGNRWTATLVDEGEFETSPAWSELRLEVNTNGLVSSNPWDFWAFDPDGDPTENVEEKNTTYRLSFDPPPSTTLAVFRLCSARGNGAMYSRNAVGFVQIDIPRNTTVLMSIPFNNMNSPDGVFSFGETDIANHLPVGSSVLFWDVETQKWNGGMKSAFGWDPAEFNYVLRPGEGFCVMNPAEHEVKVIASGEVPSAERISVVYCGAPSWSAMANPYPTEDVFEQTTLAQQLGQGSLVRFWNSTNQNWETFTKDRWSRWTGMDNRVLAPGEAFFIQPAEHAPMGEWEVAKPYAWP